MFERITKDTQQVIFYLFVILALAFTANRTLDAARVVLPRDVFAPWIALSMYDVGALGWLSAFLKHAKGTQRTIAFWMVWLSLAGIAVMVAGSLSIFPPIVIRYAVVIATLLNSFAVYGYHISSPENKEQIETQNLEDHLQAEALSIARMDIEKQARQLGLIMSRRVTARIKYRLTLPMTAAEKAEWKDEVVEGQEISDTSALPGPTATPLWQRLLSFFGSLRDRKSREPITTTTSKPADSEEPEPQPAPAD